MTNAPTRHVDAERLSAWISGDLAERDATVVRTHVEGCRTCCELVAAIRQQVVSTRELDRPEPPPTLWAAIEGALERPAPRLWSWRATLIGAMAGAAAVGAVVVFLTVWRGGGQEAVVGNQVAGQRAGAQAVQGQGQGQGNGNGAVLGVEASDPLLVEAERELERAAISYEQAVARLRKILEREQALWDPETRARVGERLARLDAAVAHSRAEARRDPGDSAGADMLFSAYQRQIEFLAEAVHRGSPASAEGLRLP